MTWLLLPDRKSHATEIKPSNDSRWDYLRSGSVTILIRYSDGEGFNAKTTAVLDQWLPLARSAAIRYDNRSRGVGREDKVTAASSSFLRLTDPPWASAIASTMASPDRRRVRYCRRSEANERMAR